jgi:hypothetical protein
VFNPASVTQTEVRFSNSNCGARFTMMALLGAGPICSGSTQSPSESTSCKGQVQRRAKASDYAA